MPLEHKKGFKGGFSDGRLLKAAAEASSLQSWDVVHIGITTQLSPEELLSCSRVQGEETKFSYSDTSLKIRNFSLNE